MTEQPSSQSAGQPWRYPLRFSFKLAEVPFNARVSLTPRGPHVSIQGHIDTLPYSAEAPDRRADLLQALAKPRAGVVWHVTERQQIVLRTEFYLAGQPSPTRFFVEAVRAVLSRAPSAALSPA